MEMPNGPAEQLAALIDSIPTQFAYTPWRHGGWYVPSVRYASGAVGCVSRNYPDKKWRVVCDPRGEAAPTYKSRDEAAAAEFLLAGLDLLRNSLPAVAAATSLEVGHG
jgi:hypothetical protein